MAELDIAAIEAALAVCGIPVSEAKKNFDDYRIKRQHVSHNSVQWLRQLVAGIKERDEQIAALKRVIADADHTGMCNFWDDLPCDCWKSAAIAECKSDG